MRRWPPCTSRRPRPSRSRFRVPERRGHHSKLFAGRTIDQPSLFIAGASDWGSYQSPGALERMQNEACTDMRAVHMVDGAGHWVQQEQPEETSRLLIDFLESV